MKKRTEFIIHDVHHSDARFRTKSEKETKLWVQALELATKGELRYLLEFSGGDTTTEVSFKPPEKDFFESGVICDYLWTQEQKKLGLPGIHIVAVSDGIETNYMEVDFAKTEYKLARGKNKNFAHERVGKEVELYQEMKRKNQIEKLKIKAVDGKIKTTVTTTTKVTKSETLPPPPLRPHHRRIRLSRK